MSIFRAVVLLSLVVTAVSGAQLESDALLNRLNPQGYVSDFAQVFSAQERNALEGLLRELEQKTGAQMAVVSLPSLQGGQIDDFANRLFENWGIGRKDEENGLLLLAAIEDRKARVEVGYGLEPVIPDARAGRILDQAAIPSFRQGRYAEGLTSTASVLAGIIAESAGVQLTGVPPAARREQQPGGGMSPLTLILLLLAIPFLIRRPWLAFFLLGMGRRGRRGGFRGGGFGSGGGFGGFGGGLSGGGGASRGW